MSHLNKKALGTGVAMVALSSFVPNPFLTNDAFAQATASDTMNITAAIVNPLSVNELTKLNFGTFAVKSAGALSINNAGATTITNGVVISAAALGKVSLKAPANATFTLSIPDFAASDITLSHSGGGGAASKTLLVTKIFIRATSSKFATYTKTFQSAQNVQAGAKITTGTTGTAAIGGRLTFTADNIPGTYTGTYNLISTF